MRRLFFLIIAGILSCCVLNKPTDTFTLNLIHTNDLHAHLLPFDNLHDCALESECLGGFARLISFLQQEKTSNSLILDAGDRFTGTSFYTLTKSKSLLPLFKEMPYDVVTLGNHEFDDNLPETIAFLQKWGIPVVVANLKIAREEPLFPLIKNSVILEKEGRKIGIIGVLTQETAVLDNRNISVDDIYQSISREIHSLEKQGVNIIVVLSHIGLEADKQLAQAFPQIDVIVGGHSHSLLNNNEDILSDGPYPMIENQGRTLIVTAGIGGQFVGRLQVRFDEKGDIVQYQGNTIPMNQEVPNNSQAVKLIENAQKEIDSILSEEIGILVQPMGFTEGKNYCDKDCPIGKYLARVLHEAYPMLDGVLLNSGSIRRGLPSGILHYQNLIEVFPFDNEAVLIQLTGRELKKFLEHGVSDYHSDMKTNALLQTSGISYDFSVRDKRVSNIFIKDQAVDLDKKYTFLISSYLANGGDGYPRIPNQNTNTGVREILKKEIKKMKFKDKTNG